MTALCLMSVVASCHCQDRPEITRLCTTRAGPAPASSAGENLGRLNELRAAIGIAAVAGALESLRQVPVPLVP